MNFAALLRSHDDDAPSGANLEYDPAFTALELAAQPGEERQIGESVLPAEDPDWTEVAEKAQAILERSHDLRAAVHLANARLRSHGLPGLAEVTGYIRACLEQHWDTCHPQLDAEDDNDPTMRINAVLALADPAGVLRGLRLAPLTDSRNFGRISLRDIAIAEGEARPAPDMERVPDAAAIAAAFRDTDPATLARLRDAARDAAADLAAIDARFAELVPGRGPDLDAPRRLLQQALRRLAEASGEGPEAPAAPEAAPESAPPAAAPGAATGGSGGGAIGSPAEVTAAIDRIIAYYRRHEPSSPVPLLLARARRLVGADFLSIMKDMAPSGVDSVNLIGGIAEDDT
jgi:type VI secretion system protein ImpA